MFMMPRRDNQREMLIAGALAVVLFLALAGIWTDHGPPPDGAFVLILGYFGLISLWGAIECTARALRPPPSELGRAQASISTPPPEPPPESAPIGAPRGPRKPAPPGARAA